MTGVQTCALPIFNPVNDSGYFLPTVEDGITGLQNKIIPKEFKVSLTFNVLHVSAMGWNANTKDWVTGMSGEGYSFPYNATFGKGDDDNLI